MEPTLVAPTAVKEKKPCCHLPVSATRSLRQKSSLTKRATPGLTDINEPNEVGQRESEGGRWRPGVEQKLNRPTDQLTYLGNGVAAPPSSRWANESSGSHPEPGRSPRETSRYQATTAGGPGRRRRSLRGERWSVPGRVPPGLTGLPAVGGVLPVTCLFWGPRKFSRL